MSATFCTLIFMMISCLIALLFIGQHHKFIAQAYDGPEPLEAADSVINLPELFSNDKLPAKPITTDQCFPHIGCIRKIRTHFPSVDPIKMNTAFVITTKSSYVKVRYNVTRNCLKRGEKCEIYPFDLSSMEQSSFNPKDRTLIVIGGWNSGEPDQFVSSVKEQWLTMDENVNIIEAYWTGGSKSTYMTSVPSTKVFARQLVVFIYYLAQVKGGHELSDISFTDKLNFVGHSLGAHISGFVGKDLGGRVSLITALDPALPWFKGLEPDSMLHKSDGKLVLVLHTNGAMYGQPDALGDLDFYANDGMSQPGCNNGFDLGCSHNRACALYLQFIQNEVYLKHFLAEMDKKYHINHRLFSYRSGSFAHFQNGSAFMDHCYSTTFAKYASQTGINQCIVPVDLVTDASRQLSDLKIRYDIDIAAEKSKKSNHKLYFYTAKKTPYLNNHHLLKLKALKSPALPARCDIMINLQMSGGATFELPIKDYKFMSQAKYLEVAVPFLSLNMKSKYELAGLDAQQFYHGNTSKLADTLLHIFPKAIRVKGYLVGDAKSEKSWSKSLLGLFGFGKNSDSMSGCDLNVVSVSIQPMKKLSRLVVAYYDTESSLKTRPDLNLILESSTASLPQPDEQNIRETPEGRPNEFYISNALVGPHEEDTYAEYQEEEDNSQEVIEETLQNDIDEEPETSSIPGIVWFVLTMLTMAFIGGFVYWQMNIKPLAPDQILLTESEA